MEKSPSVDLKFAEVRTKFAQEDLKDKGDKIVLNFPASASTTVSFEEIRRECSKLLFPKDEMHFLRWVMKVCYSRWLKI